MPSIDLARLRKQAARLADFFFVPAEFGRQLIDTLDKYVDYTSRKSHETAPGTNLASFRTPPVVLRQIEGELLPLVNAAANTDAALALADHLWDEGWLETRMLAAFLLGQIPPHEGRLISRLTAWTAQIRDPNLRRSLLSAALARTRKQAPDMFLHLLSEWLQPGRPRLWADAIQASISAITDADFINLPPLLAVIEPVVKAAPSQIQLDLEQLILALYAAAPTETIYFVRDVLSQSNNPMTAITFRRMLGAFPPELGDEIREFVRGKPLSLS